MTYPRPPSLMMLPALAALATLAACSGGGGTVAGSPNVRYPDPLGTSDIEPYDESTMGPAETSVDENEFGLLLNDSRDDVSVNAVAFNGKLATAAGDHAEDMEANGYFSHFGQDGSTPADRAEEAGYDYKYISENLANNFDTEEGVHQAWMDSPSHRENMLDERAEDFGLARYDDTWVLMLGAEK